MLVKWSFACSTLERVHDIAHDHFTRGKSSHFKEPGQATLWQSLPVRA